MIWNPGTPRIPKNVLVFAVSGKKKKSWHFVVTCLHRVANGKKLMVAHRRKIVCYICSLCCKSFSLLFEHSQNQFVHRRFTIFRRPPPPPGDLGLLTSFPQLSYSMDTEEEGTPWNFTALPHVLETISTLLSDNYKPHPMAYN